ncbi:MAG: alpha/beta hydrolase [Gemmatimonadetes bacterium]|nr:alpha/beta hydrolase [Gemmatimonadota bacterium]
MLSLLLALAAPPADTARSYHVPLAKAESLWVTEEGNGPPVVLIPGLFGSAYGFRRVVPLLVAKGYRVIVVEPLGIGFSARPKRADYSLTAQADRVAAVLEQLEARGAVLVAHSVGASMAYRVAYRRPDLIRGIVSLDGGPAEAATTAAFRRAARFVPWVKWLGGIKLIRKKIRSGLIDASGDTTWITDEVVRGYTAGAAAKLDQTLLAFLGMASAKEREKLRPRLGQIRCPVLLLLAGVDRGTGPGPGEIAALRAAIPYFSVDTVPGAGHYLHEERPGVIVRAVTRLLGTTL